MKKLTILITILVISTFLTRVKAVCNDIEMNDWAEKITLYYLEIKNGYVIFENGDKSKYDGDYAYIIVVYPPSNKFKVVVNDSISNMKREVKHDDHFSAPVIKSYIHYEKKVYDIEVYGADNSACPGELFRQLQFEVPPFNEYSMYEYCQENSSEDICQMMKDTSDISSADYDKVVEKHVEENKFNNMSITEKMIYYIKSYYLYALIPILTISIYYIVKIRKYKKRVENQ